MKNRTIYEVLDSVMENYTYTIEQTGKKIHLFGKVYIERIDVTVSHEKTFYKTDINGSDCQVEKNVKKFKEELRTKVAEVIKNHAEELTDDEAMIEKLQYEITALRKTIKGLEEELNAANEKICRLELEKVAQPYPWTTPNTAPWDNPNPWSTGITWETQIGDPPGWMDKNNITCSTGEGNTSATYGNGDEVIFHTSEYKKRDPKRFG